MITKVNVTKKTVLVKGAMNSATRAVLAKLENIGYTVYIAC